MTSIQYLREGQDVMAKAPDGNVEEGVVKKIEGDRYTIAVFDETVEIEVDRRNVWGNQTRRSTEAI